MVNLVLRLLKFSLVILHILDMPARLLHFPCRNKGILHPLRRFLHRNIYTSSFCTFLSASSLICFISPIHHFALFLCFTSLLHFSTLLLCSVSSLCSIPLLCFSLVSSLCLLAPFLYFTFLLCIFIFLLYFPIFLSSMYPQIPRTYHRKPSLPERCHPPGNLHIAWK